IAFFFSSRRRHTRSKRDWSSDVCSSDLTGAFAGLQNVVDRIGNWMTNTIHGMNMRFPEIWSDSQNSRSYDIDMHFIAPYATNFRSEERRVGKEWRCRWSTE